MSSRIGGNRRIRVPARAVLLLCLIGPSAAFGQEARIKASPASEIPGHTGAVNSLAWSPDGGLLASAGADRTCRVWDPSGGSPPAVVAIPAAAWGVSWAPDSRRFTAASVDSALRIFRRDGTLEREVRLEASGAYCVSWSPGGPLVAAGLSTGSVLLLHADTGRGTTFPVSDGSEGLSTQIIALAWSPDGRRIAAGGMDFVVRILDPETGRIERELRAPGEARKDVNGLAWSPDGTRIAVCQQDGRVRIWNAGTGALEAAWPQTGGWLRAVAWSPDGKYLATAGNGRDIAVRDGSDGRILATIPAHRSPVWSLAWSPDGSRLASGSGQYATAGGDCSIRIWDVRRE